MNYNRVAGQLILFNELIGLFFNPTDKQEAVQGSSKSFTHGYDSPLTYSIYRVADG